MDPRVFTRDRVLSIVLMEKQLSSTADNKATEEDVYVSMEQHTAVGLAPPEGRVAIPSGPKYANAANAERNSFAGPKRLPDSYSQGEEEEEYVQMTPELQDRLRRNTDPFVLSNVSFQSQNTATKASSEEYINTQERRTLLEDIISTYNQGTKDKVQFNLPNMPNQALSIDGEELYYSIT